MTRKEFFKKLGIGVAAIVVSPKVIAETKAGTYPAFSTVKIDRRIAEIKEEMERCNGMEYFYRNYSLINGEHPVYPDKDVAFFKYIRMREFNGLEGFKEKYQP